MTREEVYDKCVKKVGTIGIKSNIIWTAKELLPKEAIDAIIDCAVEEARKKIKEK